MVRNEERARMGQISQIARHCERAVVTAYSELREHGTDDMSAFVACTTLYRIHHPEASLSEARMGRSPFGPRHRLREAGSLIRLDHA
jgi:hypothetical protein